MTRMITCLLAALVAGLLLTTPAAAQQFVKGNAGDSVQVAGPDSVIVGYHRIVVPAVPRALRTRDDTLFERARQRNVLQIKREDTIQARQESEIAAQLRVQHRAARQRQDGLPTRRERRVQAKEAVARRDAQRRAARANARHAQQLQQEARRQK